VEALLQKIGAAGSVSCQAEGAEIVFLLSFPLGLQLQTSPHDRNYDGPTMAPISPAPSPARYQPIALLEKVATHARRGVVSIKSELIGSSWMNRAMSLATNFDDDCPDTPVQLRGTKLTKGEPSRPGNCNSMYGSYNPMYKNSHCAGLTETRFARDELAVATCSR
jgi:hypothetical protein